MHPHPRILVLIGALAATAVTIGGALADSTAAAEPTIVVAPGDTLSEIALAHDVSVERLTALNQLVDPNRIYAGQELILEVPARVAPAPAKAAVAAPVAAPTARIHQVQPGEYLIAIAAHYGTTVTAMAKANGLANPSFIRAGDHLRVPGAAPTPASSHAASLPAPSLLHVILAGENLTGIAARYGTTVAAITRANAIADPSYIRIGDTLRIPGTPPSSKALAKAPAKALPPVGAAQSATQAVIVAEADRFGVPRGLALAVAWQESGWRQGVASEAGAVGVMQLLPATGDWVAEAMLHEPVDIGELRSNVRAGVCLIAYYLARYGGDRDRALAAYYQGQRAVDTSGIYPMSRPYIASIRALEVLFTGS
jgi:LysM repeat protein